VSAADREIAVGVAGVGHLGRHHARIYASMPGVRLVGVADRDLERAQAIAAEYGGRAVRDVGELADEIEAASVAVPTEHHREVAEGLIAAGADVLIEKPITDSVEDADALLATAQQRSRLVMVGHSERFNPAMIALAGEIERPKFFEIHRLAGFSARSTDIDVVLDLMIHDLDLLAHLDGSPVASIDAVGVQALTDRVDIANARIRMESGCVANVTASRISAESLRRIRVFQAQTYISCDTVKRRVERYRLVPGEGGRPGIDRTELPVGDEEPLALELGAFIDAVRERTPPPVDGGAGREALRMALEVQRAIESGSPR
jgi:predicted dehydrogenase